MIKCICPNCPIYLSKLPEIFVQTANSGNYPPPKPSFFLSLASAELLLIRNPTEHHDQNLSVYFSQAFDQNLFQNCNTFTSAQIPV